MDRLSALSTAFLSAEDVDPEASLVIGSCGVLEGPAPSVDELRELVASRLPLAPRYVQRVRRTPLDLTAPTWVPDPDFDVTRHVVEWAVPAPGGPDALDDWFGEVMGARMDRTRPLWDVTMADGLDGGRWALVCRLHHALADGVSGTELLRVVYDHESPDPPPKSVGVRPPESRVKVVDSALRAVRGGLALGGSLLPVHGPSVTGPIRYGRRYLHRRVTIRSVREVRHALGVTLNDVALASVAGGFRALLEHRGLTPHRRSMRSLVPVSAWAGRSTQSPDNKVTLVLADLPVHVEDPVERLLVTHDQVAGLRAAGEPDAGVWAQRLLTVVPYAVFSRASRLAFRLPQHFIATVTTNVPGPAVPLSCLGRTTEEFMPYVPIADQVRVGVAMFSYCGDLTFGFTADRDVEDLDVLADAVMDSWSAVACAQPPCAAP